MMDNKNREHKARPRIIGVSSFFFRSRGGLFEFQWDDVLPATRGLEWRRGAGRQPTFVRHFIRTRKLDSKGTEIQVRADR
jgi:hypothetical protein